VCAALDIRFQVRVRTACETYTDFVHLPLEAYTTWEHEVKGSETHQRVIRYDFGGLTCLVRFECDGYIKDEAASDLPPNDKLHKPYSDEDDFLSAFKKGTITHKPVSQQDSTASVKVERGGSEVPQHAIFDLKTRSGKHKTNIDMTDIYPQLWIKQVPNFIVAYHDGAGLFQDIRVQDVRADVKNWEQDNIDAIRRLAALLMDIVTFARESKELLEVYSPGANLLEIRKQYGEGKHALPNILRDEWARETEANVSDLVDDGHTMGGGYASDNDGWKAGSDEDEPDYTSCSAEDCGYCGKCTY
jgi:hypothetical protein